MHVVEEQPVEEHRLTVNGTVLNVATAGEGDPVVLLHGWPHTWRVWSSVLPVLARHHLVVAPDLRGLGGSDRPRTGYDIDTLVDDVTGLMDVLEVPVASVVGIDLGGPVAFTTALREPDRVTKLVVVESLLGTLPGAEEFLAAGPPWWFGFHAVPGLAETVLVGHETEYLDWFYASGTLGRGLPPDVRQEFLAAYRGTEGLRGGFEHYRAMPANAVRIADLAGTRRLDQPTLTVGGATLGTTTHRQLAPIADDLTGHVIEDGGHILPLDRPEALLEVLVPFLSPR